jgi:hypothetical protein
MNRLWNGAFGRRGDAHHEGMKSVQSAMFGVAVGLALAACGSALAKDAADPTPPGWATYVNTHYDFDICTPPALKPQGESDAGDGQRFLAADGASLSVFGRNNAAGASLKDTMKTQAAILTKPAGKVTYQAMHGDWAVLSGTQGDTIFYSKILSRAPDLLIFELRYPAADASKYKGVVTGLTRCFESSRP